MAFCGLRPCRNFIFLYVLTSTQTATYRTEFEPVSARKHRKIVLYSVGISPHCKTSRLNWAAITRGYYLLLNVSKWYAQFFTVFQIPHHSHLLYFNTVCRSFLVLRLVSFYGNKQALVDNQLGSYSRVFACSHCSPLLALIDLLTELEIEDDVPVWTSWPSLLFWNASLCRS